MAERNIKDENDEIDLREIAGILFRYKKSILLITLLTTLFAAYYAYFLPDMYRSRMLLKVPPQNNYSNYITADTLGAMMGTGNELAEEAVVFQTSALAQKALQHLDLGIRYFAYRHFKWKELYKDTPFVVVAHHIKAEIKGRPIMLEPVDDIRFRLTFEKDGETAVDKVYPYGAMIETPYFSITVKKIYRLEAEKYRFEIADNSDMAGLILGGISASPYVKDGTSIIAVYFNDTVPLRAKEILDAVSQSYIADNLEIKSRSAKKRLAFIDMQLKAINKTLQGSSQKLQQYKATNVFVSLDEKAKSISSRLGTLEAKAYALKTQISILESLLNYVQTQKSLRGINIDSSVQISRQISGIIDAIQKSIVEYDTLLVTHTRHHPQVIKLKKQLESLKRSLLDTVSVNLKTLKEEKRSLDRQIETYKEELKDLPVQEQKLEVLNRNFMVNEKIYSMLLEERATTAIVEASNISYIRILEAPYVPSVSFKPRRKMIMLVGLIMGLILGIVQAFAREFFNTTFKSLEELERYTDVPVYGIVPHRSHKRSLIHYKEAMHVMWSNLELSPNAKSVKVITVTSSVSGEGKTLTTTEFGKVIAKNGKKVIVVNLDMRKPTLHEAFDLPNTTGMSTLLSGKDPLASVIQKTSIDTLHVITSGPKPPNPTGLIMSENLQKVIEVLKTRYDYVLIDSPPIGLVADAKKIMHLSDLTLIIIRVNFSQKNFIKVVNRFYEEEKINLGIIMNDMPPKKSYGYGYGYEYGV